MRRSILALAALALVAVAAACGSEGVVSPTPNTVVGTVAQAAPVPTVPADKLTGDPAAGKKIFASAGCISCHTLAAANASGTVGPNLDTAKPNKELVAARVTLGRNVMPSFKSQLTSQQIADVAAFVSSAAGKTP